MQVKQLCIHYGSFSMFFFLLSSIIAVLQNNIHYMSCKFREKIKNQCYQTSLAVHISFDNIMFLYRPTAYRSWCYDHRVIMNQFFNDIGLLRVVEKF